MKPYWQGKAGDHAFMIMKNTINKTLILGAIMAAAFVVLTAMPVSALAYGSYNSGYYGTPAYNYGYNYPVAPAPYNPMQISCYPSPSFIDVGQSVTWSVSVSGGNGSYFVSWSGTDGLSGNGSSISKAYYTSGVKSASAMVTSGGQTLTQNCGTTVTVNGTPTYVYPYNPPTYYNYNNYYNQYPYYNTYNSLQASCSANTAYAALGMPVVWTVSASGGNGYYTYNWYGSDGLYGYGQSASFAYNSPGQKTATVTVTSGGQTVTATCLNSVNIGGYQNGYPGTNNGLDIGCFADPASAAVNQPVTWSAEASGGLAPYTYSWTGSDGLSGTQATVIKYYGTAGDKSAIVSVTSADGKTGTRSCTNSLSVHSAYRAPAPVQPAPQVQPQQNQDNGLSAAALFSLKNVPWGWVAILVILVLFATVMYLLFNRTKI